MYLVCGILPYLTPYLSSSLRYTPPSPSSGQSARAGRKMSESERAVQPPVQGAGEVPATGWELRHPLLRTLNRVRIPRIAKQIPLPAP